ncbi:MAG: LicD family protein [Cyclobacteriaceae bacterium]
MLRTIQYFKRIANIYLTSWPGSYQKKKIKILEDLFKISAKTIEKSGEEFWLDFGTLLGYHREKGIIPHDIDVDFAMHEKSYQKVLDMQGSIPPELKLYDTTEKHNGPKMYFSYKGFDVDIYFYEDLGDSMKSYEKSHFPNERQEIPKDLIYPLQQIELFGEKGYVPSKTEEYLEHIYGYIGRNGRRDPVTGFWSEKND